jgi:hypothetical protein
MITQIMKIMYILKEYLGERMILGGTPVEDPS